MHLNPDTWLSHPTWYITPTASKDGAGAGGGTLQGRVTCKDCAHQTDPPEIQKLRQSRFSSGLLACMDLSQIELRVAALLSGEPFFLNAYLHSFDMHTRSAAHIVWTEAEIIRRYPSLALIPIDQWAKHSEEFNTKERQVGKTVNFAHLFRSGAATMQGSVLDMVGELISLSTFDKIVRNRSTDLPVLWSWQESLIHETHTQGRLTLPLFGQSRSFLGGEKYEVSEIVNFPVQTTAGNTLLQLQTILHRLIFAHRLSSSIIPFLNVYDALYFDLLNPSLFPVLRDLLAQALSILCSPLGYWGLLQSHYGRTVPLSYSLKPLPSPS
jgi:hypothetical protein